MAGYADINDAAPAGGDAVSIAAELRALKAAILDGAGIEHSVAGTDQGLHAFPSGNSGAEPASANRPNGHLYARTDIGDTRVLRMNNAGGGAYVTCGTSWKGRIASSAVVNNGTEATITIQAWSAVHREYIVSAYTNGATTPTVVLSNITGADICVWIERVKGGNDELHIRNDTANPETVFYSVRQVAE